MKRPIGCVSSAVLLTVVLALTACAETGDQPSANPDLLYPVVSIPQFDSPAVREIRSNFGNQSILFWNESAGVPRSLYLEDASVGTSTTIHKPFDQAEAIARRFIEKNRSLFHVSPQFLKLASSVIDGNLAYLRFQQMVGAIEVENATLHLTITQDGRVVSIKNYLHPEAAATPSVPLVSHETAVQNALKTLHVQRDALVLNKSAVYRILPLRKSGSRTFDYYLVDAVALFSTSPMGEYIVYVDALSGQAVFVQRNTIEAADNVPSSISVTGLIIPDRFGDTPKSVPFPLVEVQFADEPTPKFSNADGLIASPASRPLTYKAKLRNEHFAIMNSEAPDNGISDILNLGDTQISWTDRQAAIEESNTHYWLSRAILFNKQILNYNLKTVLTVMVNFGNNYDNAFFHPLMKTIAMGKGGKVLRNTAHFRDVIIHEFSHVITQELYGNNATQEFLAMNEAFSDYFSAALTEDPEIARGVLINSPSPLRTIENDLVFPRNYTGQFHDDGQIFSGSLWDLRKALGEAKKAETDRLVHRARLGNAFTIAEYLLDLLYADDDNQNPFDGTPHMKEILASFERHGLGVNTVFEPR